jgi:hypothetical protein
VAEIVYAWHTADTARVNWKQAPTGAELPELLDAAREQCLEFATGLDAALYVMPVTGIPARWRTAHLLQTRALWTAKQTAPQDGIGLDGAQVRVYPMDLTVKALLRPKRARPGIG